MSVGRDFFISGYYVFSFQWIFWIKWFLTNEQTAFMFFVAMLDVLISFEITIQQRLQLNLR